ncbi:zinc finger protein 277-like [Branchiostoma lanceolatum]|uniref:zinc finger protein 277-like n=1 Tax=Branchiostoma lanceolatum TaxID=7740 RepID=UPI0034526496
MAQSSGEGLTGDKPNCILEPLTLPERQEKPSTPPNSTDHAAAADSGGDSDRLGCLLCNQTFEDSATDRDMFLAHLLVEHKLVIADVKLIADLKRYAQHWKERLRDKPLTEFCSVIRTNTHPTDKAPSEDFYLLCDVLPEDKELREELQRGRLEQILTQQHKERTDAQFSRACLFCKMHFQGNRCELFNHMTFDHGFNVGQPDNLVYANEYLDILQEKLEGLQCLYCEKTFKDRPTLKDHMRKKLHKKINPKNTVYDKFYVINYLELGKNWESIQAEDDTEVVSVDTDKEEEWGDWEEEGAQAVCLFCDFSAESIDKLTEHMMDAHSFDFRNVKESLELTFYQQIKLVNYIRRQVHQCICVVCQERFPSRAAMLDHMTSQGHTGLPDKSVWDQPQYFFPTYENDTLLCNLEDKESDNGCHGDGIVVAEELPVPNEASVLRDILRS